MRISILAAVVAASALSACSSTGSDTSSSGSTSGGTTAATNSGSTSASTTGNASGTIASSSSTGSPSSSSTTGSPSSTGSTGSTGSAGSTGSTGAQGWHKFAPPVNQDDAFITGVYCTAVDKCVISTSEGVSSEHGALYALTPGGPGTTKLLDGTYHSGSTTDLPALAHQLGDMNFIGFSATSQGLVARADNDNLFAINKGDVTSAAAWQVSNTGTDPELSGGVGGFKPMAIQADANNNWLLVPELTGSVVTSTQAPSASTGWTEVWDPLASPSVPANFDALYSADPSLCNTQVATGGVPSVNHGVAITTDLSVIVAPSGGLNQIYTDMQSKDPRPGVCISTDHGAHFYYSAFNNLPAIVVSDASSPGPRGVNCLNKDTCFAFSGEEFQTGTGYIYYSTNASSGKTSTWTAATMPATWVTSQEISLTDLFFAPDGVHGWALGNNSRHALLVRTTDSGHTWTDVTASIASLQGGDLYSGFALDADHLWISGRNGFVAATATAQQ